MIIEQANRRDIWEQRSWKAALIVAIVAVAQGLWSVWERRRELRWKKAELGRQLVDTWFDWEASNNALTMVDEGAGEYTLEKYGTHEISPEVDIHRALSISEEQVVGETAQDAAKDRFIRKCFDVLLYNLERAERSIEIGVVDEGDIAVPSKYYVGRLARYKADIQQYATHTGFTRALKFLERFKGWA